MDSLYTPQGPVIRPEPLLAAVLEGRIRPLSRPLALAMIGRCNHPRPNMRRIEATVVADAPASLAELLDRWPGEGTPVPVSGEHATDTIWGHPDLNALFRAWHDTTHVLIDAGFDAGGEAWVAMRQLRELGMLPGQGAGAILWAETAGQDAYYRRLGTFPRLQRAFVVAAVRFGLERALAMGAEGRFA